MFAALVLTVFVSASSSISTSDGERDVPAEPAAQLKRGAFFGAKVAPVTDDVRARLKLENGVGVLIEEVIPDSTADGAGFHAGDVLLSLDGAKLASAGEFVQALGGRKAGTSVALAFRRGDSVKTENVTLKGRPLEKSDDYEVVYGSVPSRAGRLRTLITRPKEAGKHPALFLIQGIGVFSIDNPAGAVGTYKTIIDEFTRRGFVTLRVDKPGCGDSEGGPARDVDFDTELDGYRQGLLMLKQRHDVDAERVFIFGHSMGGVMAPLLAVDVPVKGIIAYGTLTRTWHEYMLENVKRQLELADTDPAEIDRELHKQAAMLTYLYEEKLAPKTIAQRHPEMRDTLAQNITEDRYFFDRSLTFFSQLADKNLGAAWGSFSGHALAIWGKADFVSNEDDHALIARIVNRAHPAHGTFLAIDGIDHGFNRATSRRESFEHSRSRQPSEFNPEMLEICRTWAEKIAGQSADLAKPAN